MVRAQGQAVIQKYSGSFIYFIVCCRYLYIGETRRGYLTRWSEHLETTGTFLKRLNKRDSDVVNRRRDFPVFAWAYTDERLDRVAASRSRSQILKYIEHQLHEAVICDDLLGARLEIISDTSRTAVTRVPVPWADSVTEDILDAFKLDFEEGILRPVSRYPRH